MHILYIYLATVIIKDSSPLVATYKRISVSLQSVYSYQNLNSQQLFVVLWVVRIC